MKRIFNVKVEWLLKGKGEVYQPDHYTVVASSAQSAVDASIRRCRADFADPPQDIRLASVTEGDRVDLVAK